MKFNNATVAILVLVVILGGYGILKATGIWEDASSNQPQKILMEDGEGKESVEIYDIEGILGSTAFSDTSEWFNVPVAVLQEAFNVSEDKIEGFQNKDLKLMYGYLEEDGKEIGNGSVKLFVALYTGAPYELPTDEITYLPEPAVKILESLETLTVEQLNYIQKNIIISENMPDIVIQEKEEPEEETDYEIKGKTTFQEVIGWGITKEEIETIVGQKIGITTKIIKEFCEEKDLSYEEVKTGIVELLDSKNKQ